MNLRVRKLILTSLVLLFFFGLIGAAMAQESKDTITIPSDRIINDDYFAAGDNITMQGSVSGDFFAAGNDIWVQGNLQRDLFAVGRNIYLEGRIDQSLRAAGQLINISGNVAGNALVASKSLVFSRESETGGNVLAAAEDMYIDGKISGNFRGAADTLRISGVIDRNVIINANHVVILKGAKIGGDLIYRSSVQADIEEGAIIGGSVKQLPVISKKADTSQNRVTQEIIGWISLLIFSAVFALFFPGPTIQAAEIIKTQPWKSLLLGLAVLIAGPILAVLLFVTVVGGYTGGAVLFGCGLFIIAGAFLGKIFAGLLLGAYILRLISKSSKTSLILSVLIGVTLIKVISLIRILGDLVNFLIFIFATGALLYLAGQAWLTKKPDPKILYPD